MDEKIIYIIFLALWGLYKIFTKKKNNKKSQTKTNQTDDQKGFFKQLGEILLGNEFYETPKTKQELVPEAVFVKENYEEPRPFLNSENSIYNSSSNNPETLNIQEVYKTEEIFTTPKAKFNLKQAIIYTTIMNRPYN